MGATYAFAAPKILPNASGTAVSMTGGVGNDGVGGAAALNVQTGQFTFVGFFKAATNGSYQCLWSNYANVDPFWYLLIDPTGHLFFDWRVLGGPDHVWTSPAVYADGNPHLIVLQQDFVANQYTIWVDNAVQVQQAAMTAGSWQGATTLYLFRNHASAGNPAPLIGVCQDWFILRRAITTGEIQNLWFNAGLGGGPAYVPIAPVVPAELPPSNGIPACNTTADLCVLVNQLTAKVNYLAATVTPSGYQVASVTPGLTGSGQLTGQNIVGVVVSPTVIPPRWGFTKDTPRRYVPALGAVQFRTVDGISQWRDIHYVDQQEFFGISEPVTAISYTLRPGVIATIRVLTAYK
jgi:hypothetical protein